MLPRNNFTTNSCPNYLTIFHPFNYLNPKRKLNHFYEKYDGYLLTIRDRESLIESFRNRDKKFYGISFYPTVQNCSYKELELHNLMVMIPVWGNRLSDPKFQTLYSLLSQSGFAKFYGVSCNKNIHPEDYMGQIPFDGSSVIDILQQHGIVLVLHSDFHNNEGIPSARIFEAAAASAVIISDENSFVKQYFGDSVFYIDTSESGESMFLQIQEHLHAILDNQSKALEMAKKAHEIFIKDFTMEQQLQELEKMHQKILRRKKWGA
jgi:hypothetical protein